MYFAILRNDFCLPSLRESVWIFFELYCTLFLFSWLLKREFMKCVLKMWWQLKLWICKINNFCKMEFFWKISEKARYELKWNNFSVLPRNIFVDIFRFFSIFSGCSFHSRSHIDLNDILFPTRPITEHTQIVKHPTIMLILLTINIYCMKFHQTSMKIHV